MSHAACHTGSVLDPDHSALAFARTAQRLSAAARSAGVGEVSFRSPPRLAGVDRSLSRRSDGSRVVAVRRHGRTPAQVEADMVEGVVAASGLTGGAAEELRRWLAGALPPTAASGDGPVAGERSDSRSAA